MAHVRDCRRGPGELRDQLALGLIEPVAVLAESGFELTSRGEAFAVLPGRSQFF
jgi:hypothetical protein